MAEAEVNDLVDRLLLASPEHRAAILNAACGSDAKLRSLAEALVQARSRDAEAVDATELTTDFLADSGTAPTAELSAAATETVGGTIGPYRLLDELGSGGMGTVYLAEQESPVRRRVALKVIKPGLDTTQVIARFEAERQALALMDHPNIARVLDAGTTGSGRPYFVMELVQGAPITRYCDTHRVPIRRRLELFLPVCRAVQHAHQKGIIHRDLKPSNIIVTLRDDQPVAKVIDFGIAKATTQRLTERTLYTQHGQLIGTPDYMSPEQAGLGGLDVDTRSDVYSLGAVLYELLCGDTPLGRVRLKQLDFVAMLNVIHEHESLAPSRRVAELGERAGEVARCLDTEPPKLIQTIRGELDWITLKALEKDRTRRYESPSALASDLERHLAYEPVDAGPPSRSYRLQKFVRRNRAPLAAAAAVATVLVVGTVISIWQAVRATQAEREMDTQRRTAVEARQDAVRLLGEVQRQREQAVAAQNLAEERRSQVAAALAQVKDAGDKERVAREEVERRLRIADAMRLAMQSRDVRERYPQRAILLAAEAVKATRRSDEPIIPAAHQALRDALESIGGRPLSGHEGTVEFTEVTPNGRWLITSDSSSVLRWDLFANHPAQTQIRIGGAGLAHQAMAISPAGQWLATYSGGNASQLHLWNLHKEEWDQPTRTVDLPTGLSPGRGQVVFFSLDSRWLAAKYWDTASLWDLHAESSSAGPVMVGTRGNELQEFVISADSRWAVTSGHRSLELWPLSVETPTPAPRPIVEGQWHTVRWSSSPSGRWLAAVGWNPQPWGKVWDLSSADPLQSARDVADFNPEPHELALSSLSFTPDDRHLILAAGTDIRIWDLSNDKLESPYLRLTAGQAPEITAAIAAGNRGGLVAALSDGTLLHWSLEHEDPPASRVVIGRHAGDAEIGMKISPSGRWLITTRQHGFPRLWDLWGGRWVRHRQSRLSGLELRGHDGGAAEAVTGGRKMVNLRSPGDGEPWLITRGADTTPRLWDLTARHPSGADLRPGTLWLRGAGLGAPRPDGKWVVLAGQTVRIVDPDRAEAPITAEVEIDLPSVEFRRSSDDVPLSADGRWLVTSHRQEIGLWDLADTNLRAADGTAARGTALQNFLNLALGRAVKPRLAPRQSLKAPSNRSIETVAISPDGGWICATDNARQMHLWNLAESDAPPTAIGTGENDSLRVFSPDSRWLVTFGGQAPYGPGLTSPRLPGRNEPRGLLLWNLAVTPPRSVELNVGETDSLHGDWVGFSGDGRWLAASTGGQQISLWQLGEDEPLGEPVVLTAEQRTWSLRPIQMSPDGRWIAAATRTGVHLWDRNSSDAAPARHALRGHEQSVEAMAISPDNKWLATASRDGKVRVWNLLTDPVGETLIVLNVDRVTDGDVSFKELVFSADNRWLAASTWGSVHFWQLEPEELLDNAFPLAGRELTSDELVQYRLNVPEVLRDGMLRRAAELAKRLQANPQDLNLLQQRTDLLACAGQFQEAIDELRAVIRLQPDNHWHYYRLLSLLAVTGQDGAFRRACDEMEENFGDSPPEQTEILERIAKGRLFWSESGSDWGRAARLVDVALARATDHEHWILPWAQAAKGLAEYRLGKHASALEWAEQALSSGPTNHSLVVPVNQVKAMAHARLGQLEEARAALAKAKEAHAAVPTPLDGWTAGWHDWYMADVMFREVEAVLNAETARIATQTHDQVISGWQNN